ncbi:C-terminal binding protein [Devosia ginsengisoli]|uniref:C-terminal binding protein n=1 Tax=Devosia ginsengisoli TaxID=400770 RepID=UPI0026EBEF91|nr:C-terminal binding protein [Devosia ginsengisoli]MCR6670754.1 C-terminal binding protein [Devosia ginsengisoli]
MVKRVVVTDSNFATLEVERAAAERCGASFASYQCSTEDAVAKALAGADVGVVQFAPVSAAAIAGMAPGARLIRYGVGYDNIDIAAARQSGRDLAYVPDYCTDEVADHTATMSLALLRRLPALDASVRRSVWSVLEAAPSIRASGDVLVGFLGLGRIGRATLSRLAPFGLRFAVHDPMLSQEDVEQLGATMMDRNTLIASVDLLILHLPLTIDSHHVIDAGSLAAMRQGSAIVNTARGGLIDEDALAVALISGRIAGAALDVFETEPLGATSPLRQAPNIILTPHAAWYSDTAVTRLQSLVADEIARALSGAPPRRPVPNHQ